MILDMGAATADASARPVSILHVDADDPATTFDLDLLSQAAAQAVQVHAQDHSSLFFPDAINAPGP